MSWMREKLFFKLPVAIFVWIALLSFPTPATAQPSAIAQTVTKLRAIKAGVDDPLPATVSPLLMLFKGQLRDLIHATLDAQGARRSTARQLRAAILAQLKREGVQFEEPEEADATDDSLAQNYVYGDIYRCASRPASRVACRHRHH